MGKRVKVTTNNKDDKQHEAKEELVGSISFSNAYLKVAEIHLVIIITNKSIHVCMYF